MAERTGLEPATPGVTGRYSNQLNYHSALEGAHSAICFESVQGMFLAMRRNPCETGSERDAGRLTSGRHHVAMWAIEARIEGTETAMSLHFINAADTVGHWINGKADNGTGARRGDVFNPAQGRVARQIALASSADVDRAVAAARAASVDWGTAAPQRRARVMFKFRDLVDKYSNDIARLLSAEHGKTLPDALGEVQRGLEVIEFACGIPQLLKGQHSHGIGGGIDHWNQRMPLGVTAGITPFNFPFMVPMWMAPMALACGNTFVLKPSVRDP